MMTGMARAEDLGRMEEGRESGLFGPVRETQGSQRIIQTNKTSTDPGEG